MIAVETFGDDLDELVEIERLQDRGADRMARDLVHAAAAGGGEDHDVRPRVVPLPHLVDELVAVEAGHHQIEEDQIDRTVLLQFLESDRTVLREVDLELHPFQDRLQQDANGQVVVDDEDLLATAVEFVMHWHRRSVCSRSHPFAKAIPVWSIPRNLHKSTDLAAAEQ